jgi:hypothetical protein
MRVVNFAKYRIICPTNMSIIMSAMIFESRTFYTQAIADSYQMGILHIFGGS